MNKRNVKFTNEREKAIKKQKTKTISQKIINNSDINTNNTIIGITTSIYRNSINT